MVGVRNFYIAIEERKVVGISFWLQQRPSDMSIPKPPGAKRKIRPFHRLPQMMNVQAEEFLWDRFGGRDEQLLFCCCREGRRYQENCN